MFCATFIFQTRSRGNESAVKQAKGVPIRQKLLIPMILLVIIELPHL